MVRHVGMDWDAQDIDRDELVSHACPQTASSGRRRHV